MKTLNEIKKLYRKVMNEWIGTIEIIDGEIFADDIEYFLIQKGIYNNKEAVESESQGFPFVTSSLHNQLENICRLITLQDCDNYNAKSYTHLLTDVLQKLDHTRYKAVHND